MKIRTDFVTNSSSSSFIAFNVKSPQLFQYLESLGLKFENTEPGEFSDSMEVSTPSGEIMEYWDMDLADMLPSCSSNSLPAWVVAMLLYEVESMCPAKELDEYTEFTVELVKMLHDAGIIEFSVDNVEEWDRELLEAQLMQFFAEKNIAIESANIEMNSGFEGEICFLEYATSNNGYELNISITGDDEDEVSLEGLRVAVTGKTEFFDNREELVEFIEELGGVVTESVTGNTDILICNDFESTSSKRKKADEYCIPVLSEEGFIRRFDDIASFGVEDDETDIYSDLFECTYDGGLYQMFHRYGIGNVSRIKPTRRKKS